jgi:hypothetical protein
MLTAVSHKAPCSGRGDLQYRVLLINARHVEKEHGKLFCIKISSFLKLGVDQNERKYYNQNYVLLILSGTVLMGET